DLQILRGWKRSLQGITNNIFSALFVLQVGFTLGNVLGMYLAQNYEICFFFMFVNSLILFFFFFRFCSTLKVPNISKKIEAFKKDVEARKKPPE
uniref:Uncharacterized protein n=1 Tax=Astyanax mexicanus TaxID=7994 RepID=A0A8B9LVP1_ASTMX